LSSKLKILHIDGGVIWGGGQSQVATLIRETDDQDVEHFLAAPAASRLWGKVRAHIKGSIKLSRLATANPWAMHQVAAFCQEHGIQIIHAHCGKSHSFAYWLKRLFLPNVSLIVHRRIPAKIKSNLLSQIKFHTDLVDHFICVSDFIGSVLRDGGIPAGKITTIRSTKKPFPAGPQEKSHSREHLSRSFGLREGGDFFILSASRLVPDKGLFILIDAFRKFAREYPNARLLIAGEGELESELKTAAKHLTESGMVTFLGFRKDIPDLLLGADVFAIPSLSEGLGSTIVEALMARTAVVGTNVEGIPELIEHMRTGLLVPPSDPEALFQGFVALRNQSDLRELVALNGYSWATEKFTPQVMVSQTLAVYRKLLLQGAPKVQ
jgi:glycosyltransferase involved in cell wall biosynthesis